MHIQSSLPFPTLTFKHWFKEGEKGVAIIKASFRIQHNEHPVYLEKQPEILMQDVFRGEPNTSSLRQESELLPFKPATDITFNAVARSLDNKLLPQWGVRVSVMDKLSYEFVVTGQREWEYKKQKKTAHWQLSEIEPMESLPLSYESAFGGSIANSSNEEDVITHEFNPVGVGLLPSFIEAEGQVVPAPQILSLAESMAMANNPQQDMGVFGLAPIGKTWLPRRRFAGKLDQHWQKSIHPKMPEDYDFRYWNGAPASLQVNDYLKGNEIIMVEGVSAVTPKYYIALPNAGIGCTLQYDDNSTSDFIPMKLDTVHVDIANVDENSHTMTLVWRTHFNKADSVKEIKMSDYLLEK